MVFHEVPQALLFRIELNINYIYEFMYQKTSYNCLHFDCQKIAELCEDRINMIDIIKKPTINLHAIIKQVLDEQFKKKS